MTLNKTLSMLSLLLAVGVSGAAAEEPSPRACSVVLYDSHNFEDSYFVITGPAYYETLRSLPGARRDWNAEASSLKVGAQATIKAFAAEHFKGDAEIFKPGTEHPEALFEFKSLKISCKRAR